MMSNGKRKDPTSLQKKKLQQEAGPTCPFCGNTEAGTWDFHHIDGIPCNTTLDNLIMVCGACHNLITKGEISEADVRLKKNMIVWESMKRKKSEKEKNISQKIISDSIIAQGNSGCQFTQKVVHAEKIVERIAPASDTLGNNANARNRLNELVK
ncbi:MAG: HNH endonuclease, partial [Sphingobacteriia bacterium]|nr:HNH endonuclease [Sphingobacteriia bacterium]